MIILITGGASGLGRAITTALANDPLNSVYFTYNTSANAAAEIEATFKNTRSIKLDFSSAEDIATLKNIVTEIQPDVLINNAYTGQPVKTYFHKTEVGDYLTDFEHNVMPVITLTQTAIQVFRAKKQGKIITILSSYVGNNPPLGTSVYVAGKAYLAQLSKSWASENKKHNITAHTISPSFMLTNLTKDTDERVIEQLIQDHPQKKLLTVDEVANTVKYLINSAEDINGMDISFAP